MLGAVGSSRGWRYTAVGKHPVARDYFRVGETEPMINGFAEWVGSGYRALEVAARPAMSALLSYRFFARGAGRDMLACGVLRDSSDALGRPYPLLLMGCGPLKGWEDSWDLLPLACEKTWEQMEYASAAAHVDVARFDAQVRGTRAPDGDWGGLSARRGAPGGPEAGIAERVSGQIGLPDFILRLGDGGSVDVGLAASLGFSRTRSRGQAAPNAVFLGGTFERTRLAVYNRSLTASDFAALWGADPSGGGRN